VSDLGLARRYCDSKTHLHIPDRENKSLTSTVGYTFINTQLRREEGYYQARKLVIACCLLV
jgi:hypothetical protein